MQTIYEQIKINSEGVYLGKNKILDFKIKDVFVSGVKSDLQEFKKYPSDLSRVNHILDNINNIEIAIQSNQTVVSYKHTKLYFSYFNLKANLIVTRG